MTPGPPFARASVVPTATVPPPAWPEAFSLAPDVSVTVPVALATIDPPLVPGTVPGAASCPSTTIDPPTPFSATVPL